MVILVMSCDKNQDLFSLYHYCMEKYWPTHPEIVYCTETIINPYYRTIPCGEKSWGLRMRQALEQINDEFILLTLDDIFIRKPVSLQDEIGIKTLIKVDKSIGYINLEETYFNSAKEYNEGCNFFPAHEFPYKASAIINLFRKECLYQLANDVSPGDFELQDPPYNYTYLITKNRPVEFGRYVETIGRGGIVEGKWTIECLLFFAKEGIDIEYNKRGIKGNK